MLTTARFCKLTFLMIFCACRDLVILICFGLKDVIPAPVPLISTGHHDQDIWSGKRLFKIYVRRFIKLPLWPQESLGGVKCSAQGQYYIPLSGQSDVSWRVEGDVTHTIDSRSRGIHIRPLGATASSVCAGPLLEEVASAGTAWTIGSRCAAECTD